jgi:hypothetical protein
MAEALSKPLPDLSEDAFTRIGAEEVSGGGQKGSTGGAEAVEHLFEDPEVGVLQFGMYCVLQDGLFNSL